MESKTVMHDSSMANTEGTATRLITTLIKLKKHPLIIECPLVQMTHHGVVLLQVESSGSERRKRQLQTGHGHLRRAQRLFIGYP